VTRPVTQHELHPKKKAKKAKKAAKAKAAESAELDAMKNLVVELQQMLASVKVDA
jgi:hypothetical protein